MTPIAPLLTVLLALATSPAAARPAPGPPPTLQPDDTTESFVTRWNEWAEQTDPDRSVIRAIAEANEAIDAIIEKHREDTGYGDWVLQDPTAPGHWTHANRIILGTAHHTPRLREHLAAEHAAIRFPTRAELLKEARHSPADITGEQSHNRGPINHAEMFHIGQSEEAIRSLRDAARNLSYEASFSIAANGDPDLIADNIVGMLDATRLIAERRDLTSAFYAIALESLAISLIQQKLVHHTVRIRYAALRRLQDALLRHEGYRARLTRDRELMDRAHTELLAVWFEPEQPQRLTRHGRRWYDSRTGIIEHWRDLGWHHHRLHPTNLPPPDSEFAPAAEQIRVYRGIADAFARDAASAWHDIEELESERLFRSFAESDPEGRLAPALSLFHLHDNKLAIDLREEMRFRATLTILAVYRHHAHTGAWPESLAAINPDIMRSDPIDPHSGQPFGYAVIDDQPTLWSAGPDRDNDDGRPIPEPPDPPEGEMAKYPANRWFTLNEWAALPPEVQAEYDGDIILFPPTDR